MSDPAAALTPLINYFDLHNIPLSYSLFIPACSRTIFFLWSDCHRRIPFHWTWAMNLSRWEEYQEIYRFESRKEIESDFGNWINKENDCEFVTTFLNEGGSKEKMERVDGKNKGRKRGKVFFSSASGTTTIIFGMEMMFWKGLERRRHDLQKFYRSIFIFFSFPCIIYEWEGKEDHEIELEQRLREKYDEEKQKRGTYFWTKIFFFTFQILDGERKRGRISVQTSEGIENEKMTLLAPFIPSLFSHDAVCYSMDKQPVLKEVVVL